MTITTTNGTERCDGEKLQLLNCDGLNEDPNFYVKCGKIKLIMDGPKKLDIVPVPHLISGDKLTFTVTMPKQIKHYNTLYNIEFNEANSITATLYIKTNKQCIRLNGQLNYIADDGCNHIYENDSSAPFVIDAGQEMTPDETVCSINYSLCGLNGDFNIINKCTSEHGSEYECKEIDYKLDYCLTVDFTEPVII